MKLKVFSIYDSKAEAFMRPFFMRNAGEAVRAFETTVRDENTQFFQFPGDFTLFEVGEWDEDKGVFKNLDAKVNLGVAVQFSKSDVNKS